MKKVGVSFIFLRYLSLILLGPIIFSSNLFYSLFLKLTIYPISWLLSLYSTSLVAFDIIVIQGSRIEIIAACVAVSAYFLLIAINLLTPMKPLKRLGSLVLSCLLLLLFNILRIFLLTLLYLHNYDHLNLVHKTLWYTLNLLIVVLIWFFMVWAFKIKNVPIFSDFMAIWQLKGLRK